MLESDPQPNRKQISAQCPECDMMTSVLIFAHDLTSATSPQINARIVDLLLSGYILDIEELYPDDLGYFPVEHQTWCHMGKSKLEATLDA